MLDRQWQLSFEANEAEKDRAWRQAEAASNHKWLIAQLITIGTVAPILIVAAAVLATFIR